MLDSVKELIVHKGFIRYLKSTSWLMAEQLLRIIAGLFVGIWVARYLGPENFGILSYALAFTAIFSGVAKLGLDGIIVRELINDPDNRDVYLGTAFWLKIIGAVLVMLFLAIILPLTSNDQKTNIFVFIIASGMVFQSFEVIDFYLQSQILGKAISICKVIQLSLSSLIKIYLILTGGELIYFIIVTVIDSITLALSYIFSYYSITKKHFYNSFSLDVAKRLLKDSWPLMLTTFVVMIYMRIDQVMIKLILDEYEVGIYSAAVRLAEVFYFIPMLITSSVFPAILAAKKESEELYHQRLLQLYTFMIWFSIFIAITMTFLSEWIVVLLYGHEFKATAPVLSLLIWSGVFVFLGVAFSKYLLVENLPMIAFRRTLLGAILNIILNMWLIPIYGIFGAAMATLISQFVVNYMYDIFDKKVHEQFYLKNKAIFLPYKAFKKIRRKS